jgi:hypothetical protein
MRKLIGMGKPRRLQGSLLRVFGFVWAMCIALAMFARNLASSARANVFSRVASSWCESATTSGLKEPKTTGC